MRRRVLFCGKTIKDNRWVTGDLQHNEIRDTWISNMRACLGEGSFDNVSWDSVGEGTGERDRNKQEIFEGEIVELESFTPKRYLVKFIEGAFCFTHPAIKGYPIDINMGCNSNGSIVTIIGKEYDMNKDWWK